MKMGKKREEVSRYLPAMGGAFLLGALAGSLLCGRVSAVQQWMEARGQQPRSFGEAVWLSLALLAVTALSAFFRGGRVTVLLALAGKGLTLSAQATALVVRLGKAGYVYGLAQCFLPGFFSLAAMVLLGRQSMGLAALRQSRPASCRRAMGDGVFALTCLICAGLTLLSAGLEVWLSPKLWAAVQTFLPIG